jgi:predicted HicB family RNase H-like nuclease
MAKRRMSDRFDGYTVELFLDEDGDWLAHFEEMPEVSAFGPSPEKAIDELSVAWNGVKESYGAAGQQIPVAPARRNFSGQFNIRIDKRVHRALALEAARNGLTLNGLVAQKLAQGIVVEDRPQAAPKGRDSRMRA